MRAVRHANGGQCAVAKTGVYFVPAVQQQDIPQASVARLQRTVAKSMMCIKYANGFRDGGGATVLISYARISKADQTLAPQEDALRLAGCERIFSDVMSGAAVDWPGLAQALDYARPGDVLVVWRLDRLGRSLKHLIEIVQHLQSRGIELRSLHEQIDTTTPGGQLVFHLFGALAEFERALIQERTRAGLAAARARGRLGGRPPKLMRGAVELARQMLAAGASVAEVAAALRVHRSTLYRALHRRARSNAASPPQ
jgi:DNA invertase Pin-like site-specific DNA recombinase